MRKRIFAVLISGVTAIVARGCMDGSTAGTEADSDESTSAEASMVAFDLENALGPRMLGNPDAPVKIEGFTSLSSGHSADFHTQTFPDLKSEFIDKGVVRFTYNDYPLNGPALDAAMLARCMPERRFFEFIELLFDTQTGWANESDYRSILRQAASSLGASDELINACWKNRELRQAMYDRQDKANKMHDVKSIPSFVVNGELMIIGAKPIGAFREIIRDKQVTSDNQRIYNKVAADNIDKYNAMKNENAREVELCFQAGLVAGAYLRAGNEAEHGKWKKIEDADCKNVGARGVRRRQ